MLKLLLFVTVAQAIELAVAHEKLRALQEGLAVNEGHVEELQVEQEGKDLQSIRYTEL